MSKRALIAISCLFVVFLCLASCKSVSYTKSNIKINIPPLPDREWLVVGEDMGLDPDTLSRIWITPEGVRKINDYIKQLEKRNEILVEIINFYQGDTE